MAIGCKRWLLLPPDTDVHGLGLAPYSHGVDRWFEAHLAPLRAAAAEGRRGGARGPSSREGRLFTACAASRLRVRECLQRAGDLVYVPAGWQHAVLNVRSRHQISRDAISPSDQPRCASRCAEMYARCRPTSSLTDPLLRPLPSSFAHSHLALSRLAGRALLRHLSRPHHASHPANRLGAPAHPVARLRALAARAAAAGANPAETSRDQPRPAEISRDQPRSAEIHI